MPAHVVLHAGLKGGHCRPWAARGGEAVAVKGLARVDDEEDLVNFSRERSRG